MADFGLCLTHQTSMAGNAKEEEAGMGMKNGKVSGKVGVWGPQKTPSGGSRGQRSRWGSGGKAP